MVLTACSDTSDPVAADAPTTTVVESSTTLPETTSVPEVAPVPTSTPADLETPPPDLSEYEPPEPEHPTDAPVAVNEGGVAITLDDSGTLVCARAEFARDQAAAGSPQGAAAMLTLAEEPALASSVTELVGLAEAMRTATDANADALADEILQICVAAGPQL